MTLLTAGGSFAEVYLASNIAEIASIRELDEKEFINKLATADTVIHNASTIKCTNIAFAVERNFEFTKYLIKLLEDINPSVHFILLSSMSILDAEDDQSYGDVLKMTPYAYSKYLAETYCLKSSLRHLSCVRFSTLFYKDSQKDGLSKLVFDAVKTGSITLINKGAASRDFLPLDIAGQYVGKIASQSTESHKIYNLVSGEQKSFYEISEMLSRSLKELRINYTDATNNFPVLSNFKTDDIENLGRINFSLEDKLNSYIEALKA